MLISWGLFDKLLHASDFKGAPLYICTNSKNLNYNYLLAQSSVVLELPAIDEMRIKEIFNVENDQKRRMNKRENLL